LPHGLLLLGGAPPCSPSPPHSLPLFRFQLLLLLMLLLVLVLVLVLLLLLLLLTRHSMLTMH
jgi:hypothetical protein